MSGSHPRPYQSAAPAPNALSTDKDAEMPATEKDLAEDAPWKKIQQNTFTRWCNEHLKCVNKRIGNLQTDLSDGLRLIGLLEVLSQKKMFRKYNQRPTFRQMQLENVSVALEFLDKENIKLVSIGEPECNEWVPVCALWFGNCPLKTSLPSTQMASSPFSVVYACVFLVYLKKLTLAKLSCSVT